jgi:DNA mismatch repair protein MutL
MTGTSKIHVLSEETINQIAAGEVIENPSSVVKELVENALDAGAQKITVSLEDGGRELIKVLDDGKGIPSTELSRAWQRHATSKLQTAQDLEQVQTMGFRGEALSSIASVSELTLETKTAEEETGAKVRVANGDVLESTEISRGVGTTVTVRDLFYLVPVRRKFLNTARSETQKIVRCITKLALSNPHVAFKVIQGDKEVFSVLQGNLAERAETIFGHSVHKEMISIEGQVGTVHIHGVIGDPYHCKGRSSGQYFYVNNRCVQSPMLSKAFFQGYETLPPGKFPIGVLFIQMPLEDVDVNVHPTKKEVRFLNERQVFTAVSSVIRQELRNALEGPTFAFEPKGPKTHLSPSTEVVEPIEMPPNFTFPNPDKVEDTEKGYAQGTQSESKNEEVQEDVSSHYNTQNIQGSMLHWPGKEGSTPEQATPAFSSLYLQLHGSYILFEVESGLMVVHQKRAHERILYENVLRKLQGQKATNSGQQLLFPEVLELGKEEGDALQRHVSAIQLLGFDIGHFGGNSFQVRGIPSEVPQSNALILLKDIISTLDTLDTSDSELYVQLARVYSRQASISMDQRLNPSEVADLMDKLFETQNPYVAPSGRPVVMRYRLGEFDKKFGVERK